MKKTLYSALIMLMAAFTFTSCEDVPMPYDDPNNNNNSDDPTVVVEPSGSGTLEDPFNIAAIIDEAEKLSSGESSSQQYYFKGVVKSIKEEYSSSYGNGTFYVADSEDSSEQFYIYRALYLGNKKFTDNDTQIQVGDTVIICGTITNYNGTLETAQNGAFLYSLNGTSAGGGSSDTGTPSGSGTLEDPYNVAAALQYTNALSADVESENDLYIKGIITSISSEYDTSYGNATFYISDDASASNQFYAFRILYLGNTKYSSGTQPKVGDEVILCGKVINYYGNTPETVANKAYLYSLNGDTGSGGGGTTTDTPKGSGTATDPYNAAGANKYIQDNLGNNETSSTDIYIKGIVSSTKDISATYGNATFYISDDGKTTGEQFYVFRCKGLNNESIASSTDVEVGDEVVICGKVTNYYNATYGNTYETVQNEAYIYSITKGSGGGGGTGGDTGDTSATNGDFETWVSGQPNNWKTSSSAGNATLSQSTDAHGGSYSVKVGGTSSANKRLGYKETELEAGDYTLTFYAKAATSTGASARPGYVKVTDGKVGNYQYGDYTNNISSSEWVKITHTFNISEKGTYCIVIMNSKNPGGDMLIDDVTLTTGSTTIIK